MHLARARGDQALQDRELLVHLRPPASLDQAVGRLPRDLSARRARGRGLLLLRSGSGPRTCRVLICRCILGGVITTSVSFSR